MSHHQVQEVTYDLLHDTLTTERVPISTSEFHGILCGYLCTQPQTEQYPWQALLSSFIDQQLTLSPLACEVISQTCEQVTTSQAEGSLLFSVMIPDDEQTVQLRVEALGQWCAGFVSGYGYGNSATHPDKQTLDRLQVLTAIAQVTSDETAQDDEAERDLLVVCEHVQAVAFELCNSTAKRASNSTPFSPSHTRID